MNSLGQCQSGLMELYLVRMFSGSNPLSPETLDEPIGSRLFEGDS